jgi:hypothetical protein
MFSACCRFGEKTYVIPCNLMDCSSTYASVYESYSHHILFLLCLQDFTRCCRVVFRDLSFPFTLTSLDCVSVIYIRSECCLLGQLTAYAFFLIHFFFFLAPATHGPRVLSRNEITLSTLDSHEPFSRNWCRFLTTTCFDRPTPYIPARC